MRVFAFVLKPPAASSIPTHLGEPIAPPIVTPARGPPQWDLAIAPIGPVPGWVDTPPPAPAVDFDHAARGSALTYVNAACRPWARNCSTDSPAGTARRKVGRRPGR